MEMFCMCCSHPYYWFALGQSEVMFKTKKESERLFSHNAEQHPSTCPPWQNCRMALRSWASQGYVFLISETGLLHCSFYDFCTVGTCRDCAGKTSYMLHVVVVFLFNSFVQWSPCRIQLREVYHKWHVCSASRWLQRNVLRMYYSCHIVTSIIVTHLNTYCSLRHCVGADRLVWWDDNRSYFLDLRMPQ